MDHCVTGWHLQSFVANGCVLFSSSTNCCTFKNPHLSTTHNQVVWRHKTVLVSYSLLALGYACYLFVGFITVMGHGLTAKRVALSLLVSEAAGAVFAGVLVSKVPSAAPYGPAIGVTATGVFYLVLSLLGPISMFLDKAKRKLK